jgi:hypothetical protein
MDSPIDGKPFPGFGSVFDNGGTFPEGGALFKPEARL